MIPFNEPQVTYNDFKPTRVYFWYQSCNQNQRANTDAYLSQTPLHCLLGWPSLSGPLPAGVWWPECGPGQAALYCSIVVVAGSSLPVFLSHLASTVFTFVVFNLCASSCVVFFPLSIPWATLWHYILKRSSCASDPSYSSEGLLPASGLGPQADGSLLQLVSHCCHRSVQKTNKQKCREHYILFLQSRD